MLRNPKTKLRMNVCRKVRVPKRVSSGNLNLCIECVAIEIEREKNYL